MVACNGFLGKSQGLWVCDEGFRKPPIDVPGELVENNDFRKTSLRIFPLFKKLTCACLKQSSFKTHFDFIIKLWIFNPVLLWL